MKCAKHEECGKTGEPGRSLYPVMFGKHPILDMRQQRWYCKGCYAKAQEHKKKRKETKEMPAM